LDCCAVCSFLRLICRDLTVSCRSMVSISRPMNSSWVYTMPSAMNGRRKLLT
jgi:hypothetical protein